MCGPRAHAIRGLFPRRLRRCRSGRGERIRTSDILLPKHPFERRNSLKELARAVKASNIHAEFRSLILLEAAVRMKLDIGRLGARMTSASVEPLAGNRKSAISATQRDLLLNVKYVDHLQLTTHKVVGPPSSNRDRDDLKPHRYWTFRPIFNRPALRNTMNMKVIQQEPACTKHTAPPTLNRSKRRRFRVAASNTGANSLQLPPGRR